LSCSYRLYPNRLYRIEWIPQSISER